MSAPAPRTPANNVVPKRLAQLSKDDLLHLLVDVAALVPGTRAAVNQLLDERFPAGPRQTVVSTDSQLDTPPSADPPAPSAADATAAASDPTAGPSASTSTAAGTSNDLGSFAATVTSLVSALGPQTAHLSERQQRDIGYELSFEVEDAFLLMRRKGNERRQAAEGMLQLLFAVVTAGAIGEQARKTAAPRAVDLVNVLKAWRADVGKGAEEDRRELAERVQTLLAVDTEGCVSELAEALSILE